MDLEDESFGSVDDRYIKCYETDEKPMPTDFQHTHRSLGQKETPQVNPEENTNIPEPVSLL
ncbi:hypothetical protein O9K51_08668 [Purpureocillium lavendulum]|uniref:Uncharacterized protein n=1 Tax=Purpureocillium lavendulum TaxID=1247861 RepID=A0AB34FHD5_9HYPO|nr:hypothetical protein O9K51_08668 [Purpureocillium lavendulum]